MPIPDRSRPRVLIVDDEQTFADVLAELLGEEGYTVVTAHDGVSALQLLSSECDKPGVVLCDVMLPGVTGDHVAAEVRRLFPGRHLPIVLMSASADPQVQLPAVWFMAKPLNFPVLMPLLEELSAARSNVAIATL